ncbi:MAG TPA: hypothetical protein DDW42_10120 [Desulfobacteraceae bacterium]|nr:hypothetical protein [Desulfobacteraceae bacterium]
MSSDRLDGIDDIIEYMGICHTEFYRDHYAALQPYLLTRENSYKRKKKHRIYTFKALIRAYLLKLEVKKNS